MLQKEIDYYLLCGIRKKWHQKTFNDFINDDKALSIVKTYMLNCKEMLSDGKGLYLWGANGTGKTMLMNIAFMEFIRRGYKVRIFSMDEFVSQYTDGWYSETSRKEFMNLLCTVQFLGIDEFGKNVSGIPDLVKRVMESVLQYRVQSNLPVWITANTEPKNVKTVFSEDVASLLNEAVLDVCVHGADYRKVLQEELKSKLL